MKRRSLFPLLLLAALPCVAESGKGGGVVCPVERIEVKRLPDLNVPRAGHAVVCLDGEVVAMGGHTTGFVPTPTAEYLKDGKWHLMDMAYPHDHATCVPLRSGRVMLAGGSEKPFGIGQTFSVEMYDPQDHSFLGFGCLDRKRTFATGLELDSGRVVLTGNWYERDGIEVFDGEKFFTSIGDVTSQRAAPYMFRTARDNAVIFSRRDTCGHLFDTIWVDRLRGPAFRPALFDEWRPSPYAEGGSPEACFVGDEARGQYAYLFPVFHYQPGASEQAQREAQVGIAQVSDTLFSLLPTACPVPMEGPFGRILYYGTVVADRRAQRAYLIGCDAVRQRGKPQRLYVLRIDYGRALEAGSASLTLYYTDPLPEIGGVQPLLTPDGDLMMVGGGNHEDNFAPFRAVYLLPLGGGNRAAEPGASHPWWWVAGIGALAVCTLLMRWRRKTRSATTGDACPSKNANPATEARQTSLSEEQTLIARIRALMEEERIYLKPDLTLKDLVERLGVNSRYISLAVRESEDCSFTYFVNRYRIGYAKQILLRRPDTKLSNVAMESGFSNETSFFRTFKAIEGATPGEWLARG